MILTTSDIINSIIQSILFGFVPYYCVERNNKRLINLKTIILIIILFLEVSIGTALFKNISLSTFIHWINGNLIVAAFYRKDYSKAMISYNFVYFCMLINTLIFGSIYFGHIESIVPTKYLSISILIFMYFPQFIMEYFIFKKLNKFYIIYKDIILRKYSLVMVMIITFSMNYIASYVFIINGKDNPAFNDILVIALIGFLFFVTTYFSSLQKKNNEISRLNKSLDAKINDLKKVKHDYGSQISYLYGLYLMKKYEKLGALLKEIINGNNDVLDAVDLAGTGESIISVIMKQTVSKGMHAVVYEEVDLDILDISELELQRVISNIVENSITAMNGQGLITVKTYQSINNIIIKIQNNGPVIKESIIDNIFDSGFSTKSDSSDHGFGLSIVKEIIEKHNGTIKVKSTSDVTEFKIKIPFNRETVISKPLLS